MTEKTMKKVKAKYLSLTEEINALDYLEKSHYFISIIDKNTRAWKWVVLSLHSALYGFAICASKGTNPDNVTYTTKKGKKRLIGFYDALKRCQNSSAMKMTIMSRNLTLTDQQKESIRKLKDLLRNNFEHYIPMGWKIEIHGMLKIAIDILDVIRFLAIDTGNYTHISDSQIRKIKSLIYQSKRILRNSVLYKETIS